MDHALLLILLALATLSSAHGAPPPENPSTTAPAAAPPTNGTNEFLEAHNQARAEVGVGQLIWSENLANATSRVVRYQRIKMGCEFANLTGSKYGGNQLWAGGMTVTPRAAVETWVEEKKYYNHTDNSCAVNHTCGVYTQVVWKKSLELGCAQAACGKNQASLTICFYNPPGNVVGESPY